MFLPESFQILWTRLTARVCKFCWPLTFVGGVLGIEKDENNTLIIKCVKGGGGRERAREREREREKDRYRQTD